MNRSQDQDVLIVGAGIIGGAIALALCRRGARVTLLDRGGVGGEASGSAAGMLAPQAEAGSSSPLLDFGIACRNRYRTWVQAAAEESETPIDFEARGLLHLALTGEAAQALAAQGSWQVSRGLRAQWLSGGEARELEPELRDGLPGALLLPDEAWVDSAALTRALVIAARRRGARIGEHVEVRSLIVKGGRVRGVEAAAGGRYAARWVVVAAGAWSSRIAGMPFPADWIEPCRGQLLIVKRGTLSFRHILYTHGAYAVPRGGEELILGTTVERAGFWRPSTLGGIESIAAGIARFLPAIASAELLRVAVGFRPEPRDGLPLIGPVAESPGLVVATGHFRNGILFAPLTGELVAETLASGTSPPELAPFDPGRAVGSMADRP